MTVLEISPIFCRDSREGGDCGEGAAMILPQQTDPIVTPDPILTPTRLGKHFYRSC